MIVHLSVWRGKSDTVMTDTTLLFGHHEYWNFKTELVSDDARVAVRYTVDRSQLRFVPDSPLPVDGAPPL